MKAFIITLAVIVLGGAGYTGYAMLYTAPAQVVVELPAVPTTTLAALEKKIAFSELVKQGGSYECTVKQVVSDMENDGVVFLDKDRMYGEFSTVVEGVKVNSSMIMKDGYTYTWSSMMPKNGFKIRIEADTAVNNGADMSGTYSWNAKQIGDYYCKEWTVNESKFTLPAGVKFTEIKR